MKKLLYTVVILLVIVGVYFGIQNAQKPSVTSNTGDTLDIASRSTSARLLGNSSSSMPTSSIPTITTPAKQNPPTPIGGNKDLHGCVLGGGYSWDPSMGACVRPWEKLSVLVPSKKWYLVNSDGTISDSIYFETNTAGTQFSGKVCNSFSGSIKINDKDSTIYVSNTVSTMMACADNNIMTIESKLFTITSNTVRVSLNEDNGHITLTASPSATSSVKMEFAPKDK